MFARSCLIVAFSIIKAKCCFYLQEIAKNQHRSVPNLIETLAINYVEKTTENNVIYETRD